jgi:hypothetical protein
VTRFAEQVSHAGGQVLLGGCIDLGEGLLPYGPVIQALRGLGPGIRNPRTRRRRSGQLGRFRTAAPRPHAPRIWPGRS